MNMFSYFRFKNNDFVNLMELYRFVKLKKKKIGCFLSCLIKRILLIFLKDVIGSTKTFNAKIIDKTIKKQQEGI